MTFLICIGTSSEEKIRDKNSPVYGVCTEWNDAENSFSYTVGVEVESFDDIHGDMVVMVLWRRIVS